MGYIPSSGLKLSHRFIEVNRKQCDKIYGRQELRGVECKHFKQAPNPACFMLAPYHC